MLENLIISLLNFFYSFSHDFGISLILFSFFVFLFLLPISLVQVRHQKELNGIQKQLKEIQKKFKDDKKAQTQALAQLFKEKKFYPFSFLLLFFIQLPILIFVYKIILDQVSRPLFPPYFLGIFDLTKPNFLFPFLIFLIQIFSLKNPNSFQYFVSFFVFLIILKLPAGLNLYLLTFTLLNLITQKLIFRKNESKK